MGKQQPTATAIAGYQTKFTEVSPQRPMPLPLERAGQGTIAEPNI
jgi:hypothetical protein